VPTQISTDDPTRRRFLSSITGGILSVISGVLALIGGGAVLSSTARRQDDWVSATTLLDLPEHEPTPVTLTMRRLDGFREVIDRRTIFLVKTGESDVAAFNATCTISAAWSRGMRRDRCSSVPVTGASTTAPAP
jgi:hypothetical protein